MNIFRHIYRFNPCSTNLRLYAFLPLSWHFNSPTKFRGYYLAQLTLDEDNLDMFTVSALHADSDALSHPILPSYFRTVVMASTERQPSIQGAK